MDVSHMVMTHTCYNGQPVHVSQLLVVGDLNKQRPSRVSTTPEDKSGSQQCTLSSAACTQVLVELYQRKTSQALSSALLRVLFAHTGIIANLLMCFRYWL